MNDCIVIHLDNWESIITAAVEHAVELQQKEIHFLWNISKVIHLGIQGTTLNEAIHSMINRSLPAHLSTASLETLMMFIGMLVLSYNLRSKFLIYN